MWTGGGHYQAIFIAKEPISHFDPSILAGTSGPWMGGGGGVVPGPQMALGRTEPSVE